MKIIIVGLGVAGATAARIIAEARPEAEISVYGAEPYLYYARPKLPAFLAGEVAQDALYFHDRDWYHSRRIAVHTGVAVARVEPSLHRIVLQDDTSVAYDRLLLAAGAHPFRPPITGADLPGVLSLWTIADALRIRDYARSSRRAVVIGGGVLGLEAARALRVLGLEVTVLENGAWLMRRQLDAEGAAVFQRHIEALGIGVRLEAVTERIEGTGAPQAVLLRSGERLPADLVLIQAGGRANSEFLQGSDLQVNRGVVVNNRLETSAPDVYAAGDIAEYNGIVYGIIPAAIEQAQVAAANMAEIETQEYQGTVPSNTLKITGLDLTSIGQITGAEGDWELRRTSDQGQYIKLVLREGRLVGAILLGYRTRVNWISQAIARGVPLGQYGQSLLDDRFDWKAALAG